MPTYLNSQVSFDFLSIIIFFRLQNIGLTYKIFTKLIAYLSADSCPIINLFIDWNPLYNDEYKPG